MDHTLTNYANQNEHFYPQEYVKLKPLVRVGRQNGSFLHQKVAKSNNYLEGIAPQNDFPFSLAHPALLTTTTVSIECNHCTYVEKKNATQVNQE